MKEKFKTIYYQNLLDQVDNSISKSAMQVDFMFTKDKTSFRVIRSYQDLDKFLVVFGKNIYLLELDIMEVGYNVIKVDLDG